MDVLTLVLLTFCLGHCYGQNTQRKLNKLQLDVNFLRGLAFDLRLDIDEIQSWRNATVVSPRETGVINSDVDSLLQGSFEQSLDAMKGRVSYLIKGLEGEKMALREIVEDIRTEVRQDIAKIQKSVDNAVNEFGDIRTLAENNKDIQREVFSNVSRKLAEVQHDIADVQTRMDTAVKQSENIKETQRHISSNVTSRLENVDMRITKEMEKCETRCKEDKSEMEKAFDAKLNQLMLSTESNVSEALRQVHYISLRLETAGIMKYRDEQYFLSMKQDGWLQYNNYLYKVFREGVNFDTAVKRCEDQDASLVEITDQEELQFLSDNFKASFWVGATDRETEGEWRWLSGPLVRDGNWWTGQPDDRENREDCMVKAGYSNYYYDSPCNYPYYYFCKRQ